MDGRHFSARAGHRIFAGRLFNFRPALSYAIALSLGVLFGLKLRVFGFFSALFPLIAFAAFAVLCACFTLGGPCVSGGGFGGRFRVRLVRFLIVCVSFCAGFGDFCFFAARYQSAAKTEGSVYVTARVFEARAVKNGVWYVLEDPSFNGSPAAGKLTLYLYSVGDAKIENEGSIVAFNAEIEANIDWTDEEGNRAYEWRRDIRYEAKKCKNFRALRSGSGVFTRIRRRLKTALEKSVSEDAFALSYAILTGETAEMNGELLENFRYGGVAHIFAVSGLHVGALFAFLTAIFRRRRLAALPRAAKFALVAAMLLFYGAICGFSASVARAIVMCLAFYADKLSGFKRDSLESMGKAAALVLLVSPVSLFDAGFLLSFSAVAGILCLSPVFSRLFSAWLPERGKAKKFKKPLGAVFNLLSVSLGATAATLPVTCRCFGYVSGVSLLLNVIVVPIVSAAFPFLLALAALAAALPALAGAILFLPSYFLTALSLLFYTIDFSPFAIGVTFSSLAIFAYYVACACGSDRVNLRYKARIFGACAGGLVFLASFFL